MEATILPRAHTVHAAHTASLCGFELYMVSWEFLLPVWLLAILCRYQDGIQSPSAASMLIFGPLSLLTLHHPCLTGLYVKDSQDII